MQIKNTIILVNFLPSVDSSYSIRGSIYPSTAVLQIGTYLKNNGYDVVVIDGAYHSDYKEILKIKLAEYKGRILFVGMSVMVTQIPFALETSKIVKGCDGEIPVVWGGPHPTLYPEQTLKNENVDIVAINEGTYTALSLAKSLRNNKGLEDIKGIGYKDSNGSLHFTPPSELEDINVLPFF